MKKAFILFALVGFATTSFAASGNKINRLKETIAHLQAQRTLTEVAEMMGTEEAELESLFGWNQEAQTVKVYNAQDELIAEGTIDLAGNSEDENLNKALLNASRLMTVGDTHIYRAH